MEVLYPRRAGLDVHARSVTACIRIASGPDVSYQHRTVPTPRARDRPSPVHAEAALTQIEGLETAIATLERHLDTAMIPFRAAVSRLTMMPGLSDSAARVLIAEVGQDMSRLPTPGHLVSWAGLCPRLDVSAGTRRSTRLRHATPWLNTTLVQAAWAATRKKDSYLRAQFLRLKSRRGSTCRWPIMPTSA